MLKRPLAALSVLGLGAEAIYYFALVRPFDIFRFYSIPGLDIGRLTNYGRTEGYLFLLLTVLLFGLCLGAAWFAGRSGRRRLALMLVLGFTALQAGTLLFAYHATSSDMVAYILESRVLAVHGGNPFLVGPAAYPDDPLLPYLTFWQNEPTIYGPVWVIVGAAVAVLSGDSLLLGLLLFKAVAAIGLLASAAAVYLILRRLRPEYALTGTVLLAWNPLVLFEVAVNGHNDVAMASLALFALYALIRGRAEVAFPLLMLSVLVKYLTVLLFPLFVLAWLWSPATRGRRLRSVLVGLGLAVALAVALYAPFWEGPATLGPLRRAELFTASPAAVLYFWLVDRGDPRAGQIASTLAIGLFGLVAAWRTLTVGEDVARLADAAFDIIFTYLCLASVWFQPWYLCLLLPFGVLAHDRRRRRLALLFSASATLNYFVFFFLWPWYRSQVEMLGGQMLMAGAVFLPPLLYLLFVWLRRPRPVA
ncbi:MAG: hypothetical protein ACYC7H_00585 [Chloroflexota bacterium]